MLQEVWAGGRSRVEAQAGAEEGAQASGSLAGIQRGGSKEAGGASRSLLEAVQSLEEREEENIRLPEGFQTLRHVCPILTVAHLVVMASSYSSD